ncbi:hypothetical protein EVAR_18855_1 [Eumeta japonica]|uniref:Uncharacterized protein n=1 Tax=Eumeta variegata TaxID=151549 RepID=A0A4C1ULQ8_EUMVA|nr:hypothetical protein EVAR_18855_1 [Eumeta japonica]
MPAELTRLFEAFLDSTYEVPSGGTLLSPDRSAARGGARGAPVRRRPHRHPQNFSPARFIYTIDETVVTSPTAGQFSDSVSIRDPLLIHKERLAVRAVAVHRSRPVYSACLNCDPPDSSLRRARGRSVRPEVAIISLLKATLGVARRTTDNFHRSPSGAGAVAADPASNISHKIIRGSRPDAGAAPRRSGTERAREALTLGRNVRSG